MSLISFLISLCALRQNHTARGTSCSLPWRSIMKWQEARSPPAWRTLETLSLWCSWTAWPRHTSSTASRAAERGRARLAATPWTGPPSWNAVACGGGPRSSRSKSPIWRMWTPLTGGHGSSSLPFSHCSTLSIGSTTSDWTVYLLTRFSMYDRLWSIFVSSFIFLFLFLYVMDGTCWVQDCGTTRHNRSWLRKDWATDQVLV